MIRIMVLDDLESILDLEHQLFSSPWTIENYHFELMQNPFGHYVVLDEEGIKGYLGLWIHDDAMQITTLGVDLQVQNRGYGKKLLEYALLKATQEGVSVITLEVRVSNTKATHLYESAGFRQITIRRDYYSHPDEDAVLMLKQMR
ncbi:MAG: ribosomal-protein-alanine N-acetyltransferase [Erysipelotrichaceae bacterium]|nr:MAG: ribosomal-protein-alanine [Erysipelotrichaceae bacterium]TXT19714.1 MAG: ribosomal-protein-alanine N-acetyltransferase [Erysipelotrichaceae bacterium]